jgi:transposase
VFVRKVKNRSGSVSVQVIRKQHGKYVVVRSFGSSKDPNELKILIQSARNFVGNPSEQIPLIATLSDDDITIKSFLGNLTNSSIRAIGPELIFGTIFDNIGFNAIQENIFRHIVIARLVYPTSKLKTVDYLYRYRGIQISGDAVYKFLDRLNKKHKENIEKISYEHTRKILKTLSVVFYDMTTLYFETEDEDDLRKIGFSKDGKFQCPQIMLGLLVGEGGYPIGYDIFEGNTFEGHTLIPILKRIMKKYGFKQPIVVADAGLLSKDNLKKLEEQKYKFIIGARIKNESEDVKLEILKNAEGMKDGESFVLTKENDIRLIITYADKRARKDVHNRNKGLKKLRARVATGKITKEQINNRGYNKFLVLSGEVKADVDEEKVKEDEKWDGLKGYVTNTTLESKKVVEHYGHLWQIEKAFRISKTDLRIRPIFHYKKRRIEAHICISFVAYAIWKELERLLKLDGIEMSPTRASELARNMYELEYILPHSKQNKRQLLKMDDEQKLLYGVIHK